MIDAKLLDAGVVGLALLLAMIIMELIKRKIPGGKSHHTYSAAASAAQRAADAAAAAAISSGQMAQFAETIDLKVGDLHTRLFPPGGNPPWSGEHEKIMTQLTTIDRDAQICRVQCRLGTMDTSVTPTRRQE